MKKLIVILFLVPFIFSCSKDDDDVVYVLADNTVTEYRIDHLKVNDAGAHWNNKYVTLTIYNERNEVVFSSVFADLTYNFEEDIFALATDSKLRMNFKTSYDENADFLIEMNPIQHVTSPTTFNLVVDHNVSFSNRLKVELSGTIINVSK